MRTVNLLVCDWNGPSQNVATARLTHEAGLCCVEGPLENGELPTFCSTLIAQRYIQSPSHSELFSNYIFLFPVCD